MLEVRLLRDTDDAAALGDIVLAAYTALPGNPVDEDYDAELRDVAARAEAAEVAVAELDGRLVGCVTYVPDVGNPFAEFDDPEAAGFRMLGVDPTVQGSGAGRALVEWCIARARGSGRARLLIHSGEWMTRAHALYERYGFVRQPERDWEPMDGVVLLAYGLELR
jgi:GNAT superfamily N-acetyltransferase